MVKIYKDYADEPDPVFLPLPEELACRFYDLEMESFTEDLPFYREFLPATGPLLEIGCGSGRVARRLASALHPAIGIDISKIMATRAAGYRHPHCRFLVMDMLAPAFATSFSAALLAYNTLNLLAGPENIATCLRGIHALLDHGGRLLLQIFIPSVSMRSGKGTQFQFQIFELPEGGRVIKEIRTTLQPLNATLVHEERYRLRPTGPGAVNRDYRSIRTVAALPYSGWLDVFAAAGFSLLASWGDYHPIPYDPASSTHCLLALQKKS